MTGFGRPGRGNSRMPYHQNNNPNNFGKVPPFNVSAAPSHISVILPPMSQRKTAAPGRHQLPPSKISAAPPCRPLPPPPPHLPPLLPPSDRPRETTRREKSKGENFECRSHCRPCRQGRQKGGTGGTFTWPVLGQSVENVDSFIVLKRRRAGAPSHPEDIGALKSVNDEVLYIRSESVKIEAV
ncbi:hypothetical protein K438DRAFT_1757823 [Mycena galopus ATCC 62051]|nr:hypothetical protein K438DRAFT_1757823 [Mycena galopus ATCC 62051]